MDAYFGYGYRDDQYIVKLISVLTMEKEIILYLVISIITIVCIYLIIRLRKRSLHPLPMDEMEGHDFEYYCAEILKKNGLENVEVTKGSGDYGVVITNQYYTQPAIDLAGKLKILLWDRDYISELAEDSYG